ncbi:hypothetical protein KX928_03090 [Roseobacter sp. YSTF-M11]|uniref:Translocase n=1 Tax=Roseobacter insulae TaxID=2859783 RepID=A0A9X1FSG7_9RHOB|nr:hypothetical protein [Roseobacter insulae]MBW4706766.1 hypothetical protein [Roseobacter insulae]
MSHKTEIMTAVGTLACAVGIGFVMQSGEVAELRYGSATTSVENIKAQSALSLERAAPADLEIANDEPVLDVSGITLTSAEVAAPQILPSRQEPVDIATALISSLEKPAAPETHPQLVCPVKMTVEPHAAAMVKLSLTAPCMQNERVTVSHNGLQFTETTSDTGGLDVAVPAMSERAEFSVAFANGHSVDAIAQVPGVALYDRVAVQWQGADTVQIHAREFGASYGDAGHVWAGAARDVSAVVDGRGGFLTRHGDSSADDGLMIEVYTYPSELTAAQNALELSVETEVTNKNCGREVEAKALKLVAGAVLPIKALSLAVPGCDAIGDFLVLNNPLQDLTVASN